MLDRKTMPTCLEILTKKHLSPELFNKTDQISLDMPIEKHVAWIFDAVYSKPYRTTVRQSAVIARQIHGIQHVTRVAIYIPIFANLYKRFGDKDALNLNDNDIKLLQIAALFHDAGREAEGKDLWDQDSGVLFYHYAVNILQIDPIKAKLLAEAIANKDASTDNYEELINDTWVKRAEASPINIHQKLIHDADCLDILRARDCFDARYLYFYKNIASRYKPAFMLMAKLIPEARSLIASQGDAFHRLHMPTKRLYENQEAYPLIKTFIEEHQTLYPLTLALLKDHPLIEGIHYQPLSLAMPLDKEAFIVSAASLTEAMLAGELFARGVGSPSAYYRGRTDECVAEVECRKLGRRPGIPTRTQKPNNLEKDGNPNRSVSMIGGARPFAGQGFLLRLRLEQIHHISSKNAKTGRGKKKNLQLPTLRIKEKCEQLSALHTQLQIGGTPSHNEIICTIKEVDAIYYSNDPTYYNRRMYGKAEPLNEHTHYLQALFLQLTYKKMTGIELPIFKYSADHNQITAAPNYTEDEIVAMWIKIVSELMQEDMESGPGFCQPLETLKIRAIDGCPGPNSLSIKFAPLDVNYPPVLRQRINAALEAEARRRSSDYYRHLTRVFGEIKDADGLVALLKDSSRNIYFNMEEILPAIKDRLSDLIQNEMHLFKLFYQPLAILNVSHRDLILTAVEGQLDKVVTDIGPILTIFKLPLERFNATQRVRMLSGIQGQLKNLIKERVHLLFLLNLSLEQFPYLLRVKLLDALDSQLKTLITEGFHLHQLFELPLDKLSDRQRGQIWNAVDDRLDIIISNGRELHELLALPLDKLDLLKRIKIWKSVQGRLNTLITQSNDLFALLQLPLANLNHLQQYVILDSVENQFPSLIENGRDLHTLLALPSVTFNPRLCAKIWTAVEDRLGTLITNYNQLYYLLALGLDQLKPSHRDLILDAINLEDLIEGWDILYDLFALPLDKLTAPNRIKIWTAIESHSRIFIMEEHLLYPLMNLSLEQLTPSQRDHILAAIQDRVGDFIKDTKDLYSFLTLNTLNSSQRDLIIDGLLAHLDTVLNNGDYLLLLFELPIAQLDMPQRIKILSALNNRLGTLINHGHVVCGLLHLPLEKFSALQRQTMLAAIEDKLGTLINQEYLLFYLMGLSLEQLTYLQRVQLFKVLEYQLTNFIRQGFQLHHWFELPLDQLNYHQRQQIWRALKDDIGIIINRVTDLHDLLELPLDKLDNLQRITIWNAVKDDLDCLITNGNQLISLFELPVDRLNHLQRDHILASPLYDRLGVLFENKTDLLRFLAISPNKLISSQRIKILIAIESQLSSLETDDNELYKLLKSHLEKLQTAHPYGMFTRSHRQTESCLLSIDTQTESAFVC